MMSCRPRLCLSTVTRCGPCLEAWTHLQAAWRDRSPAVRPRPALPHLYSLNQYLPQHSYPSDGGEADGQGTTSSSSNTTPASTVGPSGFRGGFLLGCSRDLDSSALDNMSLSLYTSTASCSDMSACCEESEVMLSDYDSGEEDHLERLVIPDSQQHTEV